MAIHKVTENIKITQAIVPQQCTNNDSLAGTGVSMANYEVFAAIVEAGTGMESDIEIAIYESTDNTTYTAISGKTGTLTSNTENASAIVECRAEELGDNNTYVQVQATVTTGTQTMVSAVNIRAMSRYAMATLPS